MKTILKTLPKLFGVIFLAAILALLAGLLSTEVEKNNKSLAAFDVEKEISAIKINTSTQITHSTIYEPKKPRDPRAISIQKYLRMQKSELADNSDLIVELSDKYKIDYKLVIAIAGLESGYCYKTSFANNCWGFGRYSWSSLDVGVKEYFRLMSANYFKKGMNTIEKIAPVYNSENTQSFLDRYYKHFNMQAGY